MSIDIKRLIRTEKLGKQDSSSLLVSLVLLALHIVWLRAHNCANDGPSVSKTDLVVVMRGSWPGKVCRVSYPFSVISPSCHNM